MLVLAGSLWSAVGLMLCIRAGAWLLAARNLSAAALGTGGAALAIVIHRFGFSRIARRNIDRISRHPDMACLFAFQAWKSYVLIAVMIGMGIALRHSGIPLEFLAVVYAAIGGALMLSSLLYYAQLRRMR
jgi:hypothetical protein